MHRGFWCISLHSFQNNMQMVTKNSEIHHAHAGGDRVGQAHTWPVPTTQWASLALGLMT